MNYNLSACNFVNNKKKSQLPVRGTKLSFLQNVPPDLSQCVFVIEQALSVRALQEIISSNDAEAVQFSFLHIMSYFSSASLRFLVCFLYINELGRFADLKGRYPLR